MLQSAVGLGVKYYIWLRFYFKEITKVFLQNFNPIRTSTIDNELGLAIIVYEVL